MSSPPPPTDTGSEETEGNSQLPVGWQAVWDEEYQRYYYYNEATGQATWDKPPYRPPPILPPPGGAANISAGVNGSAAEGGEENEEEAEEEESTDVPSDLPEGWVEVWDEEYQMYYYHNAATGESTWNKPGAVVTEYVEPKSLDCGLECTGKCDAVCGDGLRVGAEGCDDGNTVDGDGCSAVCSVEANFECVAGPWQAVWDEEYSMYYYWNSATGESVWVRPARQTFESSQVQGKPSPCDIPIASIPSFRHSHRQHPLPHSQSQHALPMPFEVARQLPSDG